MGGNAVKTDIILNPSPERVFRPRWYFGGCTTPVSIRQRYLEMAKELHPDQGGDEEAFKVLNAQYQCLQGDTAQGREWVIGTATCPVNHKTIVHLIEWPQMEARIEFETDQAGSTGLESRANKQWILWLSDAETSYYQSK